MAKKIDIAGQLNSAAADNKLADASQIYDSKKGKFQEKFNEDIENKVESYKQELEQDVNNAVANLIGGASETFDTLKEFEDWVNNDKSGAAAIAKQTNENKTVISNLQANTGISEYPAFDPAKDYAVGDVVVYEGRLKRFTAEHAAGAWIGTDVEKWSERKRVDKKVDELSSIISYRPKSPYENEGSYWGVSENRVIVNPISYTGMDYELYASVDRIKVSRGDKFIITSAGSPSINVYIFTDSERNVIESSGYNANLINAEIIAPLDGFLYVNKTGKISFEEFKLIRVEGLPNIVENNREKIENLEKNSVRITDVRDSSLIGLNALKDLVKFQPRTPIEPTILYPKSILGKDGAILVAGSESQTVADYMVSPGSYILANVRFPGGADYSAFAYMKGDTIVETFVLPIGKSYSNYLIPIPLSVDKVRIYTEYRQMVYSLMDTIKEIQPIINVDEDYPPTEEYHTSYSARNSVPLEKRTTGIILTYKVGNRKYITEQYVVPSLLEEDFVKDEYWKSFVMTDELNKIEEQIRFLVKTEIQHSEEGEGYVLSGQSIGAEVQFGAHSTHWVYNIQAGKEVYLKSFSGGSYGFVMCDAENNILEKYANNEGSLEHIFKVYDFDTILYTSSSKTEIVAYIERIPLNQQVETNVEEIKELKKESSKLGKNYWTNKNIWWCGTSIPAGSDATLGSEETVAGMYPKQVGVNLDATVYNEAVGGSMCRANVRTGDYNGANISNITSALSMTNEEVELFIANYDTLKGLSKNTSWSSSLSSGEQNRMRAASFEKKLLPYLNGTKVFPDLFVIDHGHNDWKYSKSDGTSDIILEPTIENIQSGELAEDTYMTANNNANLEKFFGSLANIPSEQKAKFIASVNRNCYIGAVNFIITLILKYNPHARIVFISNYEYKNGDGKGYAPLIDAQESLADSWAFPLCEVYKYLGFSDHIIPGSMDWFNTNYPNVSRATSDVSCYRVYNPDKVHPHSDTTGDANKNYAGVISEFIKTCR